ncbi:DUF427 domain-containing protein [Roseibium sediminicola]|uniref:DUF427 domain-containing protein n=1 Tax=Roseibium sediminicola TaxID=2933272 RepID=A0ABT0GTV9_9HYPH|nr:DUF427 domain-containing protein [Roseibium sp. CAU 1639]MCK7612875.1 DUF427 domain-containing protein [Roseibium sp. CAU 1639]
MTLQTTPALEGAIRNPDNPDHLMVIRDVPRRIRVYDGAALIADSKHALRVLEIGKSFYDPVLYIPEADLKTRLGHVDRTTFCPIKGEASYVSHEAEEIGWVYRSPIAMANRLKGHYAFWSAKVRVVEGE